MGRATPIMKRTSHVEIRVAPDRRPRQGSGAPPAAKAAASATKQPAAPKAKREGAGQRKKGKK